MERAMLSWLEGPAHRIVLALKGNLPGYFWRAQTQSHGPIAVDPSDGVIHCTLHRGVF